MKNMPQNKCIMERDDIIFNLKEGLKTEYRAKEACENLLSFLNAAEDKRAISGIITDEEKHIKITEQLIKVVENYFV